MRRNIYDEYQTSILRKDWHEALSTLDKIIKEQWIFKQLDYIVEITLHSSNDHLLNKLFEDEQLLEMKLKSLNHKTPLILASDHGVINSVKSLLGKGANINAQEKGGFTALIRAVQNGSENIIDLLLQHSPDISLKVEQLDWTAEDFAKEKSIEIQQKLYAYREYNALNKAIESTNLSGWLNF